MAIQKKSLISSRTPEKKAATKKDHSVGEAKSLTAKALTARGLTARGLTARGLRGAGIVKTSRFMKGGHVR
jgi:hypothetical protein